MTPPNSLSFNFFPSKLWIKLYILLFLLHSLCSFRKWCIYICQLSSSTRRHLKLLVWSPSEEEGMGRPRDGLLQKGSANHQHILWRKVFPVQSCPWVMSTAAALAAEVLGPRVDAVFFFFFKILFIYSHRMGGRKRGRETSMCGCLLHIPYGGRNLQPRHVPWPGIELVTFSFPGWHSVHWTTPARVMLFWNCGSSYQNLLQISREKIDYSINSLGLND